MSGDFDKAGRTWSWEGALTGVIPPLISPLTASGEPDEAAIVMLPATGPATDAARQATDEGADALVVGSPYYYTVDGDTQERHVEAILGRHRLLGKTTPPG